MNTSIKDLTSDLRDKIKIVGQVEGKCWEPKSKLSFLYKVIELTFRMVTNLRQRRSVKQKDG